MKTAMSHAEIYSIRAAKILIGFLKEMRLIKNIELTIVNFFRKLIAVQIRFKEHVYLLDRRRKVLKFLWVKETTQMLKEDHKSRARTSYIDKVAIIKEKTRDGIIEKWLSYVKSENLTDLMLWRLRIIQHNF